MNIARQLTLLIKLSVLLLCSHAAADGSGPLLTDTRFTLADCIDFINDRSPQVSCGFIELPSDHDNDTGRIISLPILIAKQTLSGSASDKAILIPGGGGPGGSMGFGFGSPPGEYLSYYRGLRDAGFDIIIVDQRGAGFARPGLRCVETSRAFKWSIVADLTLADELAAYSQAIAKCHQRLVQQGINLTDFDTYQSARDFLEIINALPYSTWGTLATSYATVIVQAMEQLKPDTFERIVLDSPVPMDYQEPFTLESSKASITRVLTLCEATRRCSNKYKNIKDKFQAVIDKTRDKPLAIRVKVVDTDTRPVARKLIVNDHTLLDMLVVASYNNYRIADIPRVIDQLNSNNVNALIPIAEDYWYASSDLEFADALSWTVHCKERLPLEQQFLQRNPSRQQSYSAATNLIREAERLACKEWDIGTRTLKNTTMLNPETLIITGDLDPVISKADVANTIKIFRNKKSTNIAGMGHSVWYQSQCTRENVEDFFSRASNQRGLLQNCRDGIARFK